MECEHAAAAAAASSASASAVGFALRACPFLKAVAAKEGDDFAARFSIAPLVPAAASAASAGAPARPRPAPPLEEQAAFAGFASSYSFFHGEGGVVPLVGAKAKAVMTNSAAASQQQQQQKRCPFLHAAASPALAGATRSAPESEEAGCVKVPARSSSEAAKAGQAGQREARERGSPPASPWSRPSSPSPSSSSSSSMLLLPAASAPFASISLRLFGGGMPDGGEWVRRLKRHQQQQKNRQQKQNRQRKPGGPASSSSSSSPPGPSSSSGSGGGGGARGPAPPRVASRAPPGSSSFSLRPRLPPRNSNKDNNKNKNNNGSGSAAPSESSSSSSEQPQPRCPLRDWPVLGALLPLAAGGETLGLNCPRAVVALRAAVARVPQVRSLRPRPLWLKGAAVAAAGAAANMPFGAWRAHTEKFSLEWFVAVHATVPFVAALRQATLLPRWALVLTVAGAVAGQMLGARVEEARLRGVEEMRRRMEEEAGGAATKAQRRRRQEKAPASGAADADAPPQRGWTNGFPFPPPLVLRSGGAALSRPFDSQRGSTSVVVV